MKTVIVKIFAQGDIMIGKRDSGKECCRDNNRGAYRCCGDDNMAGGGCFECC